MATVPPLLLTRTVVRMPNASATEPTSSARALVTALGWWNSPGRVNRWRIYVLALAAATVAVGWPISMKVSDLRIERFHPDSTIATAAQGAFGQWHMVSLALSVLTAVLAGVALAMAAKMPVTEQRG